MNPSAGTSPSGRDAPRQSGAAGSPEGRPAVVFCADPEATPTADEAALPSGFGGQLSLRETCSLGLDSAACVLQRLESLVRWAHAQQAQVISRIQDVLEADVAEAAGQREPSLSLRLAAAEVGTVLNVPHVTAMSRVFEARELCSQYLQTLASLGAGTVSYRHAQEILDQARSLEEKDRGEFESDLLSFAEDSTVAKFRIKARRLRECRHPETIPGRHRDAFSRRRVSLEPLPDGMSCVSAFLAAEKGQAIFAALSGAARGAKKSGDGRSLDQLRADIFASALLDSGVPGDARPANTSSAAEAPAVPGAGVTDAARPKRGGAEASARPSQLRGGGSARRHRKQNLKTEIMVLIQADTLTGSNDAPAELNGYGPLSPETGRRMFQEAANWTPLIQDPSTGEILHVGRRRRIPAGLKRWLQARDGTCRFPGCSVSVQNSEIDHTRSWAWGGPTDHGNLEHLCPKHHRLKTLGYWVARQPEPGVIEWTSPGGVRRRTEPMLGYWYGHGQDHGYSYGGEAPQEHTGEACVPENGPGLARGAPPGPPPF